MKIKRTILTIIALTPGPLAAQDCGLYEYKAQVVRVYDGDTIFADIDLGFGIMMRNEPLRLYRVDTPEVKGEGKERGLMVRDALAARIEGEEGRCCRTLA